MNVNRLLCISLQDRNNINFSEVNGILHILSEGAKLEHFGLENMECL